MGKIKLTMQFDPQLLSDLPKKYEEELRTASSGEVARLVEKALSIWLPRSCADIDALLYSGATLGRLHPERIDAYVEKWLEADPCPKRLDIASLFLWGYWPFAENVCIPLARRLLGCLSEVPKESSAYGSVVLALCSVFSRRKANMSPDEFQKGRGILQSQRQILRETGIQRGILATLDDLT